MTSKNEEKDPNQSEPKKINTDLTTDVSDEETEEYTLDQRQHDQDKRLEAIFRNQRKISNRKDKK